MNILILSSPNDNAAGIVAYDIAYSLSKTNNVLFIGKHKPLEKYSFKIETLRESKIKRTLNKLNKKLNKKKTHQDYYFFDKNESKTVHKTNEFIDKIKKNNFKPDAILIIFYQNFLKARNIKELYNYYKAPVYMYMMDYAPLTGGCHYYWDCRGFEKECGKCPAIYSQKHKDQSYYNLQEKKNAYNNIPIILICSSSIDQRIAEKSTLFKHKKIKTIHIPINSKIFKPPENKTELKRKFNVENKFVIFCGASNLNEKRKGGKELIYTLNILFEIIKGNDFDPENIVILQAGGEDILTDKIKFNTRFMGYLNGQKSLAEAFQSSDLFISPSIQDAGPMMIYQATMCGLQFAAFNIGLAKEMKEKYDIGLVSDVRNIKDLTNKIFEYLTLDDNIKADQSKIIRNIALNKWSLNSFVYYFEKLNQNFINAQ
jgi:glycosyltransferase involved in cell wall biosynthesis